MRFIKNVLLFFFFILNVGCVPPVYKKTIKIKNEYNISKKGDQILIISKKFSPLKEILKKLKNQLTENNVIIFSWINHMRTIGTNDYYCLIYNYDSNKRFYIKNTQSKIHEIIISNTKTGFESEDDILIKYLEKGKISFDKLKPFSSAEFGSRYSLIDTKNNIGFSING